ICGEVRRRRSGFRLPAHTPARRLNLQLGAASEYFYSMARAPSLAGVILAAGESTRMQRDMALLGWQGKTFLGAAMESLRPHCQLIIVVAGKNVDSLKPVVFAAGGFLVVNPNTY